MKILLTLVFALSFEMVSGLTIDELSASFAGKRLRISSDREESLHRLREGYLGRLEKLRQGFQKAGRLDDVLASEKEKALITAKKWPLPPLPVKAPAGMTSARKLYLKGHLQVEKTAAKALTQATDTMVKVLNDKKIANTKAGKIDEAKKAMKLGQELVADTDIVAARNFLERSRLDQLAPPALRLRRFGDNLEVLVRYDLNGKVSMDSPVENVIEETGGKGEKGKTNAKVLGEFVGAKGYQVASFVVYHQDFKKRELGTMTITSFEQKLPFKVDGGSGLKITLPGKALNSHLAVPHALPPLTDSGRYRVTCRYFLPTDNRHLKGFHFHQGFGADIENFLFSTKGKWTTRTISSASLNEHHYCRLYPFLASGKKLTDAAGESIILGELKIEQTTFSAYLHSRYNADRQISESFPKAADQKKLISAGVFLTS